MQKNLRWILLGIVALVVILGVGVMIATRAADPMPQALAALQSDSQVDVSADSWLALSHTPSSRRQV